MVTVRRAQRVGHHIRREFGADARLEAPPLGDVDDAAKRACRDQVFRHQRVRVKSSLRLQELRLNLRAFETPVERKVALPPRGFGESRAEGAVELLVVLAERKRGGRKSLRVRLEPRR